MKTFLYLITLLFAMTTIAQEETSERIVIPLSNPGERGTLDVELVRGNIDIQTYDGKDVIIQAKGKSEDDDEIKAPNGMKRIKSNAIEIEASEKANKVSVETNSWKKSIDLEIKVPKNFDLDVGTIHGEMSIDGVDGAIEAATVHGPLTIKNVSGSVLGNTVHGDVVVTFNKVTPSVPMSFATLHGNVDVTLPAGTKATAKMKTDRGEIYTDFDMDISKSQPEKKSSNEQYRVSINSWVTGKIGGGGADFTFQNMYGDIYIRKK